MSTLRNQVQLIGRLGADAEIKMTSQGRPYVQVRFATNDVYKTSSGEWKENTQWHNLVVWGEQLTKVIEQHGRKGNQLLIQGSLQYREYTDNQEIKRTVAEVKVQKIMPFQNQVKSIQVAEETEQEEESADLPF